MFVEFGTPNSGIGSFVWASLSANPQIWAVNLIRTNIPNSDGLKAIGFIFDSGSSYINAPNADMTILTNMLKLNVSGCYYANYMINCPCTASTNMDATFPAISLTFGDTAGSVVMTLTGAAYMVYSSNNVCTSLIRGNVALDASNYWLLGLPVYRSF